MKKVLLIAIIFLGITNMQAQVKLGFGVGYAHPSGDAADFLDGGASLQFELGYGVTERIDVSFVYGGDLLTGSVLGGQAVQNLYIARYMVNGRYFFTDTKFKPYASLGLGLTRAGQLEVEISESESILIGEDESNFAWQPAIGFKYGVFNMNIAYLSAGKVNNASISDISVNVGLLFTIGGNK